MPHFNEAQLELSIIKLFLEQHYDYRPGETIARADKAEVEQARTTRMVAENKNEHESRESHEFRLATTQNLKHNTFNVYYI